MIHGKLSPESNRRLDEHNSGLYLRQLTASSRAHQAVGWVTHAWHPGVDYGSKKSA